MNRKFLIYSLKLLVSLLIIIVLARSFDFSQVYSRLDDLSYRYIIFALFVSFLLAISNTFRWQIILRIIDHPIAFWSALKMQYIAGFFNQALPSIVGGDAVRVYLCYKAGTPLQKSLNSVILERMIILSSLIFLVTILQIFVIEQMREGYAHYIFPVLSFGAVLGTALVMILDRLPSELQHFRVIRGFSNMAVDARRIFLSLKNSMTTMALGLLGNVLLSIIAYLVAKSLGVEIQIIDALVLVPPAILVSSLPISIAGWGVREGAMVATLAYAGVSEVDAIIISVIFGVTIAVSSLPGACFWLMNKRDKKKQEKQNLGCKSKDLKMSIEQ